VLSYDYKAKKAVAASVPTAGAVGGPNAPLLESFDTPGQYFYADLTKAKSMGILARSICLFAMSLATNAFAADLNGTWRYEKGAEYFGQMNVSKATVPVIQIVNNRAAFSPICFVELSKGRYLYSGPFQSLLKEDVNEAALEKYLNKNFSFSILGSKDYFKADVDADCNDPMFDFLLSGNKLLVPFAGSAFYTYVRTVDSPTQSVVLHAMLVGRKLSQLPFSPANYANLCQGLIPRAAGIPSATAKCAPVYYPYVALNKDADWLAKLIGAHNYRKGGARDAEDYAPPFASKLHPVFVVLPPLKDVLIVRVNDLEGGNEERDTMPGVYLAIKGGKVTDQVNEGCVIDETFACFGEDGKKRYQLLESGKFKKI